MDLRVRIPVAEPFVTVQRFWPCERKRISEEAQNCPTRGYLSPGWRVFWSGEETDTSPATSLVATLLVGMNLGGSVPRFGVCCPGLSFPEPRGPRGLPTRTELRVRASPVETAYSDGLSPPRASLGWERKGECCGTSDGIVRSGSRNSRTEFLRAPKSLRKGGFGAVLVTFLPSGMNLWGHTNLKSKQSSLYTERNSPSKS